MLLEDLNLGFGSCFTMWHTLVLSLLLLKFEFSFAMSIDDMQCVMSVLHNDEDVIAIRNNLEEKCSLCLTSLDSVQISDDIRHGVMERNAIPCPGLY